MSAIKEALGEEEQEHENLEAEIIQETTEQAEIARLSVEKERQALETEIQIIKTLQHEVRETTLFAF